MRNACTIATWNCESVQSKNRPPFQGSESRDCGHRVQTQLRTSRRVAERSGTDMRGKLGLLVLAIFLWGWFSVPLPQAIALYWLRHHSGVVSLYGTESDVIAYYKQLIWGAVQLSFIGPFLLWLIPRKVAGLSFISAVLGCLVGGLGGQLVVALASPADQRVRDYPIHPKYFVLASLFAGLVAGYLRILASQRDSVPQKLRFVIEGIIAWFAVLQIFVGIWMPFAAGNAANLGSIQLDVALPAFFWSTFCCLILWKRRPRTRMHALLWAMGIGLVVSKLAAGFIVFFFGMMGHIPEAFSSWVVARLEWPAPGLRYGIHDYALGVFVMFGPSLLWGLVMGLRRWRYLQAEQPSRMPPTVS
jgi:hypothetical protein